MATREGRVGIGTALPRENYAVDVVGTGTFTGALGAAGGFIGDVIGDITGVAGLAAGLTGVPDIEVDEITSIGINSIFIRNTGVSTFGGEISVGNFVGVGSTSSALGRGLGVIGGADFRGDGTFSGNVTIGGDLPSVEHLVVQLMYQMLLLVRLSQLVFCLLPHHLVVC